MRRGFWGHFGNASQTFAARHPFIGHVLPAIIALAVCGVRAGPVTAQTPVHGASAATTVDAAEQAVKGRALMSPGNLLHVLREGGPLLWPLAVCSFLLFVFVFERSISLRRGRVIPRPFVRRFLRQLQDREFKREEALSRCQENNSPVAEVFAAAITKWDRPAVEVEQAIIDAGERVANGLRKYLRLFNGISTISPLLGLLGTVVGMIKAFNVIATSDAMGRPEMLASGISQALLTTAAGLVVAIPAIVAYLFFSSRVDGLIMEIDRLGQEVVHAIACDTWVEPPARKTNKPPRSKAA